MARQEPRWKTAAIYGGAALTSLIVVFFVMQLWRADLKIPLHYEWRDLKQGGEALDPIGSNDVLLFSALFKGMTENGWYLHNPAIGAPYGMEFNDYPFADTLHFAAIKVLSLLTGSWPMAMNFYFLLGFPLTVLTSLYVFRQLKISWLPAVVGSLLFTFSVSRVDARVARRFPRTARARSAAARPRAS